MGREYASVGARVFVGAEEVVVSWEQFAVLVLAFFVGRWSRRRQALSAIATAVANANAAAAAVSASHASAGHQMIVIGNEDLRDGRPAVGASGDVADELGMRDIRSVLPDVVRRAMLEPGPIVDDGASSQSAADVLVVDGPALFDAAGRSGRRLLARGR